jgi:hypothetical protein
MYYFLLCTWPRRTGKCKVAALALPQRDFPLGTHFAQWERVKATTSERIAANQRQTLE